jgi:hypothetical protein
MEAMPPPASLQDTIKMNETPQPEKVGAGARRIRICMNTVSPPSQCPAVAVRMAAAEDGALAEPPSAPAEVG